MRNANHAENVKVGIMSSSVVCCASFSSTRICPFAPELPPFVETRRAAPITPFGWASEFACVVPFSALTAESATACTPSPPSPKCQTPT